MLHRYRVFWMSGGCETVDAFDFDDAVKRARHLAARRFLKVRSIVWDEED